MRLPRPTSIRVRLLRIAATISLLSLAIASALFVATDVALLRRQMVRDLEVLAAAVGDNCQSALIFDAPETAQKNLASLRHEPQVRLAVLSDAQGRPFASYRQAAGPPASGTDPPATHEALRRALDPLGLGSVEVSRVLTLDGEPLGQLRLLAHTDELAAQLWRYGTLVGVLLLGTLTFALGVAMRLHRRVADPLRRLAKTTREVSAHGDYGVRVAAQDCDAEIADLIRGFNLMLAELGRRDAVLGAHAAALDRANVRLRALTVELGQVEERERQRLAGALHDSAMQKLAIAQMQIAAATAQPESGAADERLEVGLLLIREALNELRELQFELSPPALGLGGLPAALEALAAHLESQVGLEIRYRQAGVIPPLPPDQALLLYRCARELLYNTIKHAGAGRAVIALQGGGEWLELAVEDDGVGFPPAADVGPGRGGSGLARMGERLAVLGGRLAVRSGPAGARVAIHLPRVGGAPATA